MGALRVLIIVPAYNEQEALGGLLDEIRALEVPHETVVVDDGSSDRTSEVARAGGARVLRFCGNLGIGGAVQSGIRIAHREGFDYAVQVDGDGQHPPAELARMIEVATTSGSDIVVGSRYQDTKSFRSTIMRRAGSFFLRSLLRLVGVKISDPTSGFRLYGKRALALFDDTYPYDYPEPESLALARVAGLRIAETPVMMRERQGGSSSIGRFSAAYYMLKVTIAIVLTRFRARRKDFR